MIIRKLINKLKMLSKSSPFYDKLNHIKPQESILEQFDRLDNAYGINKSKKENQNNKISSKHLKIKFNSKYELDITELNNSIRNPNKFLKTKIPINFTTITIMIISILIGIALY